MAKKQRFEATCTADDVHTWVVLVEEQVAAFSAMKLHQEDKMGEIYMIAVDPTHQGQGIGVSLTNFSVNWLKEQGMALAMVETGGDPGHGPARRTYEKAGFGLLPIARYFQEAIAVNPKGLHGWPRRDRSTRQYPCNPTLNEPD